MFACMQLLCKLTLRTYARSAFKHLKFELIKQWSWRKKRKFKFSLISIFSKKTNPRIFENFFVLLLQLFKGTQLDTEQGKKEIQRS
jgi:hypothetical protein